MRGEPGSRQCHAQFSQMQLDMITYTHPHSLTHTHTHTHIHTHSHKHTHTCGNMVLSAADLIGGAENLGDSGDVG